MKTSKPNTKLSLSKTTIKDLSARTGIKAGGCAKNWTNAQSHDKNGCAGGNPIA